MMDCGSRTTGAVGSCRTLGRVLRHCLPISPRRRRPLEPCQRNGVALGPAHLRRRPHWPLLRRASSHRHPALCSPATARIVFGQGTGVLVAHSPLFRHGDGDLEIASKSIACAEATGAVRLLEKDGSITPVRTVARSEAVPRSTSASTLPNEKPLTSTARDTGANRGLRVLFVPFGPHLSPWHQPRKHFRKTSPAEPFGEAELQDDRHPYGGAVWRQQVGELQRLNQIYVFQRRRLAR